MRGAALICFLLACGDDGGAPIRDAAPGPDGPVVDAAVGIACTDVFCDLPDTFCCAEALVPPRISRFCVDEPEQNVCMGNRFFCDGPEDCGDGEVCCTNSANSDVRCAPDLATCLGQGFVVCHVNGHCPAPQACVDTPLGIIRACQ